MAKLNAERGLSVRKTENLVRGALKGEGGQLAKGLDLSVISDVLKTESVHAQLLEKIRGAPHGDRCGG